MCFDFRRARSHPLGPTITCRLPGRLAMYTPEEVHVKVLPTSTQVPNLRELNN
jgi:hypothetical protein